MVTPEQSKHIKPVDMAILSMIPQDDLDLTAYPNELLRTNKPEQRVNTFWFPTPENPGKPEDHTQYRQESSGNLLTSSTRKNSIRKRAQNLETIFLNNLIGPIQFLQKQKNKQLKTFWSNIMTFSPDTECILG